MTREFLGLRMQSFQGIAFIWRQTFNEIFKSELVYLQKNIWDKFLMKNQAQNVVEKLVTDLFLKIQNWAYLSINSLKWYKSDFILCLSRGQLCQKTKKVWTFFLIGIHSMQTWTATKRHEVTKKEVKKIKAYRISV